MGVCQISGYMHLHQKNQKIRRIIWASKHDA